VPTDSEFVLDFTDVIWTHALYLNGSEFILNTSKPASLLAYSDEMQYNYSQYWFVSYEIARRENVLSDQLR
jgi:hypothetical protein